MESKKTLEEKFDPAFEIVEDSLVSMKCRCSCAPSPSPCPASCPPPKCYSTDSPSAECMQEEVDSKYKL